MSNYALPSMHSNHSSNHNADVSGETAHQYVCSLHQTNQVVKGYDAGSGTMNSSQLDSASRSITTKPVSAATAQSNDIVKIVCISDTHNGHQYEKFRDKMSRLHGDILIHAGDFSDGGSIKELECILSWLCSLCNFKYKVLIAGNTDGTGFKDRQGNEASTLLKEYEELGNIIYLENSARIVSGIKIYGCPYTPRYYGGFQYDRGSAEARRLWEQIPHDCDLLISHGPPRGILDQTSLGQHVGCQDLLDVINQRKSIQAVVCGHVHNDYGFEKKDDKWFINASQCNGLYRKDQKNQPIQFSMDKYTKKILDPPTVCFAMQPEEFKPRDIVYNDQSEQRTFNETVRMMGYQPNMYGQSIHPQYADIRNDGYTMHETVYNQGRPN